MLFTGNRIKVVSGEHAGETGVVLSRIPKRYKKEESMLRVKLDGWPMPKGKWGPASWNGEITVNEKQLEPE